MSRRRGEFEHRTSIFEGAFRAWSHLGGLDPMDVETKPASELDPLTTPIEHDTRLGPSSRKASAVNADGSSRREYPYEPLPRAGLSHPFVQAILSPWLGPDADNEAIQLGLTTLRTWWQHRRKGESGSAVAALGTEKMKGVVEGYTRHFFTLAHCLIVNDKEQPPRSLHIKMKDMEKARKKGTRSLHAGSMSSSASTFASSSKDILAGKLAASMAMQPVGEELVANLQADLTDSNLTPLERLHAAQRRQLSEAAGLSSSGKSNMQPIIPINGRCIPGKIDLPGIVDAVTRQASQMVHRGATLGGSNMQPSMVGSDGMHATSAPGLLRSSSSTGSSPPSSVYHQQQQQNQQQSPYGDPHTTPVVFVSGNGDIQIAMTVDGITCAHCVKIVETVLKGCNGNKSPIEGLLDAAADRALCSVLIRIDRASSARRIAYEASRNLAMVGYTAKAKEMSIVGQGADQKAIHNLGSLSTAFEVVATTDPKDFFDWTLSCTCPDNGVLREDCPRYVNWFWTRRWLFDAQVHWRVYANSLVAHLICPANAVTRK
jgi:copper chaperone CopZ